MKTKEKTAAHTSQCDVRHIVGGTRVGSIASCRWDTCVMMSEHLSDTGCRTHVHIWWKRSICRYLQSANINGPIREQNSAVHPGKKHVLEVTSQYESRQIGQLIVPGVGLKNSTCSPFKVPSFLTTLLTCMTTSCQGNFYGSTYNTFCCF